MAGAARVVLTQDICPAQGDVRPQHTLAAGPLLLRGLASPAVGLAAVWSCLGAPYATRADASQRDTTPQVLEAISIAAAFRSSYAIGSAQGRALAHSGTLLPEHYR
jgi:hypothetical protein